MRRSVWLLGGVVVVALAGGLLAVAQAANTSRPTGKGAIRDDSVYCQDWPGGPSRPEYPGTGPQTPCGPNFQRQPPPPPPPEEEEQAACPVREAALDQPRMMQTAAVPALTRGLWVAGRRIGRVEQLGLPAMDRRRRDILVAMICNPSRRFDFDAANELQWTIELRFKISLLMVQLRQGGGECRFLGEDRDNPHIHAPSKWQLYPEAAGSMTGVISGREAHGPEPFAIRARPEPEVRTAHEAIEAFRHEPSFVDCLAGMELTVLDAADSVLGETNFNQWHAPVVWRNLAPSDAQGRYRPHVLVGLGVPLLTIDSNVTPYRVTDNSARTSLGKHLKIVRYHVLGGARGERSLDRPNDVLAGPISADDMVPGDYAYLSNLPDYRSRAPNGYMAGENAFYVGLGGSNTRYFYGYGLYVPGRDDLSTLRTEEALQQDLANHYNAILWPPPIPPASADDMQWTILGAPTLYGDPRHAGPFVR